MKSYNPLYYLLFVLLILGAFSSMAQNDYGLKILGFVAVIFAIIFLVQLLYSLRKKKSSQLTERVELISLVLIASILAMRVFYLRFPFIEMVFGLAGLMLIGVSLIKMTQSYTHIRSENKLMAWLVLIFQGSILLYVVSMTIVPFMPSLAEPSGGVAFGLLILFVVAGWFNRNLLIGGEKISPFRYIMLLKDRSIVLMTLFLLFTAYMGLVKIDALPKMYSDKYPQAYFELVNQAESGKEELENGKFKHEEFKEKYDRFVERNIEVNKK